MLGRWIDQLTDAQKDRIVEAARWTAHRWISEEGERCLIANAHDVRFRRSYIHALMSSNGYISPDFPEPDFPEPDAESLVPASGPVTTLHQYMVFHVDEANRFDQLWKRFGEARVVRAVKLRAGARITLPTPTPTPEEAVA